MVCLDNGHSANTNVIGSPEVTSLNSVASPNTFPITVTELAARISLPLLSGVIPKKIQNARPGGQYPRSPSSTTS